MGINSDYWKWYTKNTYFVLEIFQHRCCTASAVDKNEAKCTWGIGDPKPGKNICSSTFTQPYYIFYMQEVQHCDKVFSQCLQCRKLKAVEKPKSQIFAGFKIQVFNFFCPLTYSKLALKFIRLSLQASKHTKQGRNYHPISTHSLKHWLF